MLFHIPSCVNVTRNCDAAAAAPMVKLLSVAVHRGKWRCKHNYKTEISLELINVS